MITSSLWRGNRYAVLGLARSGMATVQALLASGAEVVAWDESAEARVAAAMGSSRNGEGDQRSWWRGTREWVLLSMSKPTRLCPSTTLQVVPLPVPGRILLSPTR